MSVYFHLYAGKQALYDETEDDALHAGPVFGPLDGVAFARGEIGMSFGGRWLSWEVVQEHLLYDGIWYGQWLVSSEPEPGTKPDLPDEKKMLAP